MLGSAPCRLEARERTELQTDRSGRGLVLRAARGRPAPARRRRASSTGSPPPTSPRARRSSGRRPTRPATTYLQIADQRRLRRLRRADRRRPKVKAKKSNDNTVQAKVKELEPDTDYKLPLLHARRRQVGHRQVHDRAGVEEEARRSASRSRATRTPARSPAGRRPTGTTSRSGTRIRKQKNDFNVLMGDTIYSDTEVPGLHARRRRAHGRPEVGRLQDQPRR